MNKYTWLIDAGHGGTTSKGEYLTAPAKMYEHDPQNIFYEGLFNRQIKEALIKDLWRIGILSIDVCPTDYDIPLDVRVKIINELHAKYQNAVLISLHSNAGGGTGFEVWTSHGETRSDKFAELLGQQLMRDFPEIKFRADQSDGDLDKEAAFYILKWSHCPAVLPECLFYDNFEDYKLLIDPAFRLRYVRSLVAFVENAETRNL